MRFPGCRSRITKGRSAALAGTLCLLSACAVSTPTMTDAERAQLAADTQKQMFEGQEALERPLTLAEATARAIKYQGEHRQRQMEEAASAAQLDVAKFDLLPKIA